jgi:hypothetical protein
MINQHSLIQHLSVALKDNTADFRKFGMDCIADLLETKPEQEQTLLTMVSALREEERESNIAVCMYVLYYFTPPNIKPICVYTH